MTLSRVAILMLTLVVLAACGGGSEQVSEPTQPEQSAESSPLVVYTVNYPLLYFAERIGGDRVESFLPTPSDTDPAYWSPDPEVIAAYQAADLILLNGADYAKWVARASLPQTKLVDTSASFSDALVPLEGAVTHTHGPAGEHAHTGWAFTTWLDPRRAIEQARAVEAALGATSPADQATFVERLAALEADLEALDERQARAAEAIGDRPLLFSHPVYQYLIDRYGLAGRSVHWEPGEGPDDEAWRELEEILADHPAEWMIWEGEPSSTTTERLSGLGVSIAVYEPCANAPAEGDLLSVMERNAAELERVAGL